MDEKITIENQANEIAELKAKIELLEKDRDFYKNRWLETSDTLASKLKQITAIGALVDGIIGKKDEHAPF